MTARPRYPRSSCCVLGCRRTSTLFKREWMCGEHWRMANRANRLFYRKHMHKLYRRWEKLDAFADEAEARFNASVLPDGRFLMADLDEVTAADNARKLAAAKFCRTDALMWARLKRQVTDRALGISA